MDMHQPEPEPQSEQKENAGRAVPFTVSLSLLLAFIVLVTGVRETFVAPGVERSSFGGGHFGILTEALHVFEETTGIPLRPGQDDIDRAIYLMTITAAGEQDIDLLERVYTEVEDSDINVPRAVPPGLEDIWVAMEILRRDYPDAPLVALTEAARRGLFVRGQDPALTFLDSRQYENAQEFFAEGSYEGIGARVGTTASGSNFISDVFLGSPAELAGLQAGDGIVSVDGVSAIGMAVDDLVEIVKGESGTEVVLEIRRPWDDASSQMSVTVVRGVVPTSLETQILGEDTDRPLVGYIRVERFHRETSEDFRAALGTLLERDIAALILDVRSNPGGSLSGAVSMVGEFVPDGLAMYEVTREGRRIEWEVNDDGQAFELPLAVLVNGFSASASEVVAGALQDHDRATVYGTRTYGKGSVQTFQELSDGSALYVTVSSWFTPSGRQIQGTGVTPNVTVIQTISDELTGRDAVLNAAYWDLVDGLATGPTA